MVMPSCAKCAGGSTCVPHCPTWVKISVKNLDPTPEEFESNDIGFEKIIAGNSEATIRVKPLEPGTYIYFGEFHMDTALGHIVVE